MSVLFWQRQVVFQRCFCLSVWTCIGQDLLVLLIQDNVINLIVYRDNMLCYRASSSLQPGCDILCRLLEASVCNDFTILFTEFHQAGTILISSVSWLLPNTAFGPSSSSYFAVEIPCRHCNGWWYLISNSLHSLSRCLYSFLSSFGYFWARILLWCS